MAQTDKSAVGKPSVKQVGDRSFVRTPIVTHLAMLGEDLAGIVEKYAAPRLTPTSILCLSEKFVTICQNNVRHISEVQETWLARFIVPYVTPMPDGFSNPKKMQVAIDHAGVPRIVLGVIFGGLSRLILRRRGDFYRIAGNRISEIDGFNDKAMRPFNEYAMLPPLEPDKVCEDLAQKFGCACYMIDGNNIDVQVIGMSRNMATLGVDKTLGRLLMRDNPMGQRDEMTPIFILEESKTAVVETRDTAAAAPTR